MKSPHREFDTLNEAIKYYSVCQICESITIIDGMVSCDFILGAENEYQEIIVYKEQGDLIHINLTSNMLLSVGSGIISAPSSINSLNYLRIKLSCKKCNSFFIIKLYATSPNGYIKDVELNSHHIFYNNMCIVNNISLKTTWIYTNYINFIKVPLIPFDPLNKNIFFDKIKTELLFSE